MNIFDTFKEIERDDMKQFANGWNTIKPGNEVTLIMSNWKEV